MLIHWSLCSVGASAETHAKNRQELYEVSKALEQAAKKQQAAPARQGKKGTSSKHNKAGSKVGSSALVDQPGSPAVSKRHKSGTAADGPAAGSGQIDGSVESPGTPAACCMTPVSCLTLLCAAKVIGCLACVIANSTVMHIGEYRSRAKNTRVVHIADTHKMYTSG